MGMIGQARAFIGARLGRRTGDATLEAEREAREIGTILRARPKPPGLRIARICAQVTFQGLADKNATNLVWNSLRRLRDSGCNADGVWIPQTAA